MDHQHPRFPSARLRFLEKGGDSITLVMGDQRKDKAEKSPSSKFWKSTMQSLLCALCRESHTGPDVGNHSGTPTSLGSPGHPLPTMGTSPADLRAPLLPGAVSGLLSPQPQPPAPCLVLTIVLVDQSVADLIGCDFTIGLGWLCPAQLRHSGGHDIESQSAWLAGY